MASALPSVLVLNGPNLGRLGVREPEIYGHASMADLEVAAAKWGDELGLAVAVRQTDDESEIVGWLHEAVDAGAHVVLNPAAFTHYSYALRDAAAQVTTAGLLLVEVHLSNPCFFYTSAAADAYESVDRSGRNSTNKVWGKGE
ncbi:type II 3-dehydroquinate dehydratase, partial [Promicromonospora sp. NPDC059942]|uniref:type II 3-dehydroquinate dehydratase n=1 Tax=Promicromonospora sp. NPDC059942 TaxID=3347009 RepID=UPI0036604BB0